MVAGLPLACLLVGCVGCFQVGWGGLGVLCSGCEVGLVGVDGRDAIWWGGWVVSCWCAALGFECLVACCGFPLSSGPLLRCVPCCVWG